MKFFVVANDCRDVFSLQDPSLIEKYSDDEEEQEVSEDPKSESGRSLLLFAHRKTMRPLV